MATAKPPVKKRKTLRLLSPAAQRRVMDTFLEALRELPHVEAAARKAKIAKPTIYRWRATDAEFAAQWDAAIEQGLNVLHDEAIRRAYKGVREPVFYKGQKCGQIVRYSDTVLLRLLEAHDSRFKKRQVNENVYPEGMPVQQHQHTAAVMDVSKMGEADAKTAMDMYRRLMLGEPAVSSAPLQTAAAAAAAPAPAAAPKADPEDDDYEGDAT